MLKKAAVSPTAAVIVDAVVPKIPERQFLPQGNTLLSIYGPWLFNACQTVEPAFLRGRCQAFAALCRIVCTRCGQPYEQLYVSSFYQTLFLVF